MINIYKYDIMNIFADIFKSLEIKGYLVGGAVRDMLMGINPVDFDFVGEIGEERHIEASEKISKILNCKYEYNRHYHTSKFFYNGYDIDFVMARKEFYEHIAAKPRVYASDIIQDLKRRDFTINTMALPMGEDGKQNILDPFKGREDLINQTIKVLHSESFKDDPTRVFRGIKYASRFGFKFDEYTEKLIIDCVEKRYISYLKPDRIKQELILLLNESTALKSFEYIKKFNILDFLAGANVNINLDLKQDEFYSLDVNRKFSVLLYNNLDVLDKIRDGLRLGNNVIDYIIKAKELGKKLAGSNDEVYRFLIKNQNNVDEKILKTLFYKDERITNFIKLKDKIRIKPEDIGNIGHGLKEEHIANKKLEIFNMYLTGGIKDDEF